MRSTQQGQPVIKRSPLNKINEEDSGHCPSSHTPHRRLKSSDSCPSFQMNISSRFKIVPLESRYKRGRWDCYDYYEKDSLPMVRNNAKLSCPGATSPPQTDLPMNRNVRSLSEFQVHSNSEYKEFDDDENLRLNKSYNGAMKITEQPRSEETSSDATPEAETVPQELGELQKSLILKTEDESSSTSNVFSMAIDSKIEQAMDLVKTHLMFAVREEVEVLRGKICELETHINQLETENAVLREHVPPHLLRQLMPKSP